MAMAGLKRKRDFLTTEKRTAKVKSDLIKLKQNFISLIVSPFKWDINRQKYFLIFLALLTLCFFADVSVREYVKTIHNNFFDQLFAFTDRYGKPPLTIYTFLIFYFGGLFIMKDNIRSIGLKIFESFIFSGIIVTIIKSILGRWRPYTEHGSFSFVPFTLGPNEHLSLPSGDAAVAFAFTVIIAGIFENKLWKIFWYLVAVLTAIGRIYHDQHWLSDVVLGSAISITIGNYINKKS